MTSTAADAAHAGRPMYTSRDGELRRAALDLVAQMGYDRVTIEAVAARARAGKATVYRRWPSKAALVVDAFCEEMFGGLRVPDTGSLRDDLVSISTQIWGGAGSVPRARVMAGLVPAMVDNHELRDAVGTACRLPESVFEAVVRRAVERGEIGPVEAGQIVGWVVPSLCLFQLMRCGTTPDGEFCATVIDRLVMPALRAGQEEEKPRR